MNKKGAIEFSITTIIIIIIGISILALALPWVARMMQQTSQLTDTAFEQAKTQLAGELSAANPVMVVPSSLSLAANDQTTVSVGCYNTDKYVSADKPGTHVATLTGASGTNIVVKQSADGTSVSPGGKYYWGIVINADAVTSATPPEVMSLNVNCAGLTVPITKPLTVTFR